MGRPVANSPSAASPAVFTAEKQPPVSTSLGRATTKWTKPQVTGGLRFKRMDRSTVKSDSIMETIPLSRLAAGKFFSLREDRNRMALKENEIARVSADALKAYIARAFTAVGIPAGDAATLGHLITEADL